MTALPASSDFTGSTVTEGQFKAALTGLRDFLSGLLGTDGVNATALAALGALGSGYAAKTAAYTVVVGDRGKLIAASGTWTLSLPAAATAGSGFSLAIRNTGAGLITIDPNAAELINGVATVVLAPGHAVQLVCTGAGWLTVGVSGSETAYFGDGSTAAPAISFPGDTNTGFTHPAGDQIAGVTNGVQRFLLGITALQLDLPLTGTAVTQSGTDTTAGRLLKVGDFGLGAAIPSDLTDLTVAIFPGIYRIGNLATVVGGPSGATGQGTLLATHGSDGRGTFLLSLPVVSIAAQRFWHGSRNTPTGTITWSLALTNDRLLGAVSQAAGVPTGAVIERGTNANGEYVKLADGTLICTQTMTASSAAATTWTYPAAFIAAPVLSGQALATVSAVVVADAAPGTTICTFSVRDKLDARRADSTLLCAIGRWF